MASQMNPVIAAFLQSRNMAEESVRALKQQEILQKRIQVEAEAQQAENEYRKGQLQLLVEKAQAEQKQNDIKNQIDQHKSEIDALGEIRNLLGGNVVNQGGAQSLVKTYAPNAAPEVVAGLQDYETRKKQEAAAKLEEFKLLMGPKAEAAGMEAKAVSDATQENKIEIEKLRSEDRRELAEFNAEERKKLEAFKQSQANSRAATRNAITQQLGVQAPVINRIAQAHDSHPVSKDIAARLGSYNAIKLIDVNTKNPGDDISLVTQYAKIIDPSVVRPSEYETVKKYLQGLPDSVNAEIKRLFNSGGATFLSPKARQSLKAAASNLMRGQVSVYLPFRKSLIDRMNQQTGQNLGETYLGEGFMPEEVKEIDGKYFWVEGGKAVPLYGGK